MQGAGDVEDLTSEVFLAMFRNIGSFSGTEANFRSWVFVIAHRRLQDERRRRFRRFNHDEALDESLAEHVGDPGGGGTEEEVLRAIGSARVVALCARLAVSGQVERQRPVAFTIQTRRHPVPGAARAAEPVQQDDRLRHTAIVVS